MMLYPAMRDLLKKVPSRYKNTRSSVHRPGRLPARPSWPASPWTTSR